MQIKDLDTVDNPNTESIQTPDFYGSSFWTAFEAAETSKILLQKVTVEYSQYSKIERKKFYEACEEAIYSQFSRRVTARGYVPVL